MIVIGLTGSIAMGKSTTAEMFRQSGIPVYDADKAVHDLYEGEAVQPIEAAFPGSTKDGVVDRSALKAAISSDPDALKKLESIVHPLVRRSEERFREEARSGGAGIIVLDIPLLLETGGDKRVDLIVTVSAPSAVQKQRVMERGTMTEEQFEAILARQMPDAEKRRRSHFVIDTGEGLEAAKRQVRAVISAARAMRG